MGISIPVYNGVPGLLGGVDINSYLLSLSPTLYTRFNETTGNLINYGSDAGELTVTSATQGQTGQLGANEAYLFDGADDYVSISGNLAGTRALTTRRWAFLVNAASLGEGSAGTFFSFSTTNCLMRFLTSNRLEMTAITDGTSAQGQSNTNQVDFLTSWSLVFADYDDADDLGLGRKVRLMRATAASATTLLTMLIDTAATGTVTAPAGNFVMGNFSAAASSTFDGLIDFAFAGAGLWSPAGSPADLTICDRIRSLVFGV